MKPFQIVLAIITLLAVFSMFGFNLWIGANFSKGLELPQCYMPLNWIATALVLVTVVTIFIPK